MNPKLKELFKKSKKFLTGAGIFLSINYNFPIWSAIGINYYSFSYSKKISLDKYKEYHKINRNLDALDYLNISSSITHLEKEDYFVCKHYAPTTYDVYMDLIKLNKRYDLKDKIRLVYALPKKRESGHVWIKINDNGKWKNYESTRYNSLYSTQEEIKEYSNYLRLKEGTWLSKLGRLNSDDISIIPPNFKSMIGKKIILPNSNVFGKGIIEFYLFDHIFD